jgi:hypothetical protein
MKHCIACGSHLLEPFYNPEPQPLTALNLPRTAEEAIGGLHYPLNFHRCRRCGHIFNVDFDVAMVPYADDSNLMYNNGTGWKKHMQEVVRYMREYHRLSNMTIIDIGAGDGVFLEALQALGANNRCIAFEPGVDHRSCEAVDLETYADYFIPARDIPRFHPGALTCRHVLEHMENPREFVADLAYHAKDVRPLLLAEVPCIDKALKTGRFGDYLYEHVSHFTERSFVEMFESSGWLTSQCRKMYNDEVLVWVGKPDRHAFAPQPVKPDPSNVAALLDFLLNDRPKWSVAFWGGTGKGAAFLNACNVMGHRVIDSDVRKAGRYVPGTGQRIEAASSLLVEPVDTVVITTRWRAADIYKEIKRDYPCVKEVYVIDNDAIRQYTEDDYVTEKAKE